jgi:plastocyanin
MQHRRLRSWERRTGALLFAVAMTVGFTACGGGGGHHDDAAYVEPKGPSTETISVEAGNFYFEPEKITTDPGIVTIKLSAENGIHDFVFDDDAYPGFHLEADGGGGSQSKKIDLTPGTSTFYCTITGHRAQGMEGTLTVK